jgi:hypothetical protein
MLGHKNESKKQGEDASTFVASQDANSRADSGGDTIDTNESPRE